MAEPDPTATETSSKTVDVTTFPFVFNPPAHPAIQHWVPDLSTTSKDYEASLARIYDETASEYAADAGKTNGMFSTLRLGRIVMYNQAFTFSMLQKGKRYGFRFLYNPTTVAGSVNVGTDFIPDPSSTIGGIMQSGLEQIQLQLLINRMPEVQGKAQPEDYLPLKVTGAEMKEMRERGTHYDIEFLYRVANGLHNTLSQQSTGDIGILLPNPCELHLGPYRSRGALFTVSTTDQLFSADMVPMLSYVNITFARYLSFTVDDATKKILASTGVVQQAATSGNTGAPVTGDQPGSTPSPDPATTTPGSGGKLTGGQVEKIAKEAGWTAAEAVIATKIAWGESKWDPKAKNSLPCLGLWQINMSGSLGESRRKDYGLKSNEDLYDPKINAHIAYKIYKGRGNKWTDWEVYTDKNSPVYYLKCPPWTSL